MGLSRDSLAERQAKFLLRKKLQIRQGLERLQWEEDVLFPTIEAMKAGKVVLDLPDGDKILDVQVVHENPDPAQD